MRRFWVLLLVMLAATACGTSAGQLNQKGNRAFAAKDYSGALEAYESAQAQSPDLAEPYYNAANTRYRQEDIRKAQLDMAQALRTADDSLSEEAYFNSGNFYFQSQQFEQAIEAYKQALRLNPADMDAKHNLELALQQLQQKKDRQQQNQQNGGDKNQPSTPTPQPSPTANSNGTPQPQATPSAPPTPDSSGGQNGEQGQNEPGQAQPSQPQQLSKDEARRLLEAITGDTKTLQQKLMELYGNPPEKGTSGQNW